MGTSESRLSQDVVFDILSSPRRRYVLYHLRKADEPVKLTDLAEQVAAWENDTSPDQITEQERKRVYVSLYQTHIPRLDEVGIVEYDKDSGEIELASEASDIDQYLGPADDEIPWQRIYLALAGLSTLLLGATVLNISVFAGIPGTAAATVVVGAFVVTTIVHSMFRFSQTREIPPEFQKRE